MPQVHFRKRQVKIRHRYLTVAQGLLVSADEAGDYLSLEAKSILREDPEIVLAGL